MKAVVLLLCLFVAYTLGNHVVTPGRYRQCTLVGDEIILDIGAAPMYYTTQTTTAGGCSENATGVDFVIEAHFQWQFADSKRRDNNGTNVEYIFSDAKITPNTESVAIALQQSCNYRFAVGRATNVLGCLFCSPQYDIYREVTPGVFVLGDNFACTPEDRPSTFENSTFVRVEVSPTPFPAPFPPQGVGIIPPLNMTYLNIDDDDDPNNDAAEDEDDEGFDNDDDEDFTATPSPTVSPSRSFVMDNGAAMLHIALGVIVLVIFVLV